MVGFGAYGAVEGEGRETIDRAQRLRWLGTTEVPTTDAERANAIGHPRAGYRNLPLEPL